MNPPGRFRSRLGCTLLLAATLALFPGTLPALDRQPVESTDIASVGYDRKANVLEVEFRSGGIYRYLEVPAGTYERLLAAESKGRFFAREIRSRYRFELVKSRPGSRKRRAMRSRSSSLCC